LIELRSINREGVRSDGAAGKSIQWIDLSFERREPQRAAGHVCGSFRRLPFSPCGVRSDGEVGKSVQWTDLSSERREP